MSMKERSPWPIPSPNSNQPGSTMASLSQQHQQHLQHSAHPPRVAEVSLGKCAGTLRPGADTPMRSYSSGTESPRRPLPRLGSEHEGAATSESGCSGIPQRLRIPPFPASLHVWVGLSGEVGSRGGGYVTSDGFLQCPVAAARAGLGGHRCLRMGQSFGQLWTALRSDHPEELLPFCPPRPVCRLLPRRACWLLPGRHPPPLRWHEGPVPHHLPSGPPPAEPHVWQGEPCGESLLVQTEAGAPRQTFYTSNPRSWKSPLLVYPDSHPCFSCFLPALQNPGWEILRGFFLSCVPGPW